MNSNDPTASSVTTVVILENDKGEQVAVPIGPATECYGVLQEMEQLLSSSPPTTPSRETGLASVGRLSEPKKEEGEEEQENRNAIDDDDDRKERVEGASCPLVIGGLLCEVGTMELLSQFTVSPVASRTVDLPEPLLCPLQVVVTPIEIDLLRRAERSGLHIQLLDLASYLKFESLVQLISAYVSERLVRIARDAENIMVGAEHVRNYLQMENEWTEEEKKHLQEEMMYALEVDPNAY